MSNYYMATTDLKVLNSRLQDNLGKGFIREILSPWCSLVLFVKNNDASNIDYRQLNNVTMKN